MSVLSEMQLRSSDSFAGIAMACVQALDHILKTSLTAFIEPADLRTECQFPPFRTGAHTELGMAWLDVGQRSYDWLFAA